MKAQQNKGRLWHVVLRTLVIIVLATYAGGAAAQDEDYEDMLTVVGAETEGDHRIYVNVGTSLEQVVQAVLPAVATAYLSDDSVGTVPVTWESSEYDSSTPGNYSFTGLFTASGADGTVAREITVRNFATLSENIAQPTTLSGSYVYQVTRPLNVDAALTIEAGAILRFENNTGLNVRNNGSLAAIGTTSNPILFTGSERQEGWWDGVQVHTMSGSNRMEHVIIEYGGARAFESTLDRANLVVGGRVTDGRLTLQNSILRNSGGWGLKLRQNSTMPDTKFNVLTRNVRGPMKVHVNALHHVDGDSQYTGNDHDYVLAFNGRNPAIDSRDQRVWQALDVPYRVDYLNRIDNSFITIESGARFEFANNAGFIFEGDAVLRTGTDFRPNGSEPTTAPTVFTGVEKTAGYWAGIQMRNTPTTAERSSILHNVIIEYGGSTAFESSVQQANLVVGGRIAPGQVTLQHSVLRHSGAYGMYLRHTGRLVDSFNNVFTENSEGPVRLTPGNLHEMDRSSSHGGNLFGNDFVIVHSSRDDGRIEASDARYWQALDVPYRMTGATAQILRSHITIEPGAEFRFDNNTGLRFVENSRLTAVGSIEEPIVFTGMQKLPGFWYGIQIGTLEENVMEHVHIAYGGAGSIESNVLEPANLTVGGRITDARLDVRSSRFSHSRGYGMAKTRPTVFLNADAETANIFNDNQEGSFSTP